MYADPSGKFAILALLIGVGISFVFEVVEDALDGNGMDHDFNEYLGAGISGLLGSMGVTAKIGSNAAKAQGGLASIIRKQSNWVGNIIYETVGSSIAGGLSSIGYGQVSNHFGWNF